MMMTMMILMIVIIIIIIIIIHYYYYKMKVSIVFCAKSISAYLPLFFYRDITFGLFATTPVSGQ